MHVGDNLDQLTMLTFADGGGDVFVGGAVPFGMVKLGIDTYEEPINQSALNGGWTPQGFVTGISLMHESGTGGGPKYGFPSQMPLIAIDGNVNLLDNRTYWQKRVSGRLQTMLQSSTVPAKKLTHE